MDFSTPTLPSLATRMPALRSRGSCRGFAVHHDRVVVFESHLELMVFYLLAIMPQVREIVDQPPAVTFVDENGVPRRHTFDFLVLCEDGTRILIAVKPAEKLERSGLRQIVDLIAFQLNPVVADKIKIVSESDFTYADRYNAAQAFECSRFPIEEHDQTIARITADMLGSVKISDLVRASGLGGMGFRAIIRLITYGTLSPVVPRRRITPDTCVICRHL